MGYYLYSDEQILSVLEDMKQYTNGVDWSVMVDKNKKLYPEPNDSDYDEYIKCESENRAKLMQKLPKDSDLCRIITENLTKSINQKVVRYDDMIKWISRWVTGMPYDTFKKLMQYRNPLKP